MNRIIMNNVVARGNRGGGARIRDAQQVEMNDCDFSDNVGPGLLIENSERIPVDLAKAIREAVEAGQSPKDVGNNFGAALEKIGVSVPKLLAVAANGAQVLQYLGIAT
jgi:hypothetical protein